MTLITKNSELADYVVTLLTTNKTVLGLQDVYYGDQDLLPRSPAVCVEPNSKKQELNGAPRRVRIELSVYVIIYVGAIATNQANRHASDELSEAVEAVLHADSQCGDRVIHSMVTENASGWSTKGGTPIRASRLNFEALSQAQLPNS
jgi:hypothetical protein